MSGIRVETTGLTLISDEGKELELKLAYDSIEVGGQIRAVLHLYSEGELVATTNRFHLSGNRLAMDLPGGLNGAFVITDGGGHITNG